MSAPSRVPPPHSGDVHGFIQFDPEERVWHVKTCRKFDCGHITRSTASSKSIPRMQKDPYLPLRQRSEDDGRNLFQPIGRVLLFCDQMVLLAPIQYIDLQRTREGRLLAAFCLLSSDARHSRCGRGYDGVPFGKLDVLCIGKLGAVLCEDGFNRRNYRCNCICL